MDDNHDGLGAEDAPAENKRVTRRKFVAGTAAAGAALGLGATGALGARKAPATPKSHTNNDNREFEGLVLTKGKIHTMDGSNRVVEEALIANGRFVEVGNRVDRHGQYRVINLKGKTVVPGLIEGHVHVVSLANRPGYHTVIEQATNIADIQAMLAARRPDVPEGQFITAMGGWSTNFFAERRLPTLAELDAAVPDRPVFIYSGGGGPAVTNSLGKAFFESVSDAQAGPVVVSPTGAIATGNPNQANRALYHLRVRQTFEDKKRSAIDAMALLGERRPDRAPRPGRCRRRRTPLSPTQGLPNLDHFRMYDPWLAVHRRRRHARPAADELPAQPERHRAAGAEAAAPEPVPALRRRHADDRRDRRVGRAGRRRRPRLARGAARDRPGALAEHEPHAQPLDTLEAIVTGLETVAAEFDFSDLRWTVHHVQVATPALLARLKALNVGVQCGAWRYNSGTPTAAGSPFRMVQESGIQNGIHMDGVHIAPLTPWFALYYTTTGVNALGVLINDGQQIIAAGGDAPVHPRERLAPEHGGPARDDRARQAGRPRRARQGLRDVHRRGAQADEARHDRRRR